MTDTSHSPADRPEVVVVDDPAGSTYRATVDGERAGVLKYSRTDGVIDLQHTVVREECEGMGVGSALIRFALAAARESGERVIPSCPFVRAHLERHPSDRDVVDR